MNEECKDLSGQHLLSVMALVPCIKCLPLLRSLYLVFRIWVLIKNVLSKIYCTVVFPSYWATFSIQSYPQVRHKKRMKIELRYLLMCHPVGSCDEGFLIRFMRL